MNIDFNTSKTRFFENEGRAFTCGNRSFQLWDTSLKGEHGLVAPYGVKTYEDNTVLPIAVTTDIKKALDVYEEEIQEKMKSQIPEFVKGVQAFHSCTKTNDEGLDLLTLKVDQFTKIEMYDVKKGTFSKIKVDAVPAGSKMYVGFSMGHPWKFTINNVMKYGISLKITEVVVFNDGELKKKIADGKRSIKDLMVSGSKKKTKMMTHKEQDSL